MKFTPKSEQEIQSDGLLPPGIYDFEVLKAEDTISKASGADMVKLQLHVFDTDGQPRTVFDYLLESVAYKLRHAAEVCDLLDDYENGQLDAEDFIGKTGKCKIAIQKDKSGQFPDRNGVSDYIVGAPRQSAPVQQRRPAMAGADHDPDDEIPF